MKTTLQCQENKVDQFLNDQLSGQQLRLFEQHLMKCSTCLDHLQEQTGGEQMRQKTRTYLSDDMVDNTADYSFDSIANTNLLVEQVLKSLSPSDDPEMLGRIGGYEVIGVIGSGGMGVVLKGFDLALKRVVAIKVLAPQLAACGAARKRFTREAQAAAAINHDNVIEIYGVDDSNDLQYLVMPYVRGKTLQQRIEQDGPLQTIEVLRIGFQVASGLAAAHEHGLVHRDVKPANILLHEGNERLFITDFGLARAVDDASLTRTGMIAGTPQFMSPEQSQGEPLDTRSDLFSLGSVLYMACTGRLPFRAENSYGILRRISDETPRPIREINPGIPEWLCRLIRQLHKKNPNERFQSANEVSTVLAKCLSHVQNPTVNPLPKHLAATHFQAGKWKWLGVALAFVFVTLAGWLAVNWNDPPDISGAWHDEDWGNVELKQDGGHITGIYSATFSGDPGEIKLNWSRVQNRFQGEWNDNGRRFGKLTIRLVDGEIRGAWTLNPRSEGPDDPVLADFSWKQGRVKNAGDGDRQIIRIAGNEISEVHGKLLSEIISEFNKAQRQDAIGKNEPLLTDDEVVAAIRWIVERERKKYELSDSEWLSLQTIAQTRIMPANWEIKSNKLIKFGKNQITSWTVNLVLHRANDETLVLALRNRAIEYPAKAIDSEEADHETEVEAGFVRLQQKIDEFNSERNLEFNVLGYPHGVTIDDVDEKSKLEPALTLNEVVATLSLWVHQRRKNANGFTDDAIDAVEHVANTRTMPETGEFNVIRNYSSQNGFEFTRPTIRMVIPVRGHTWGMEIRPRLVDSEGPETIPDSEIAWGVPTKDGLQVGVYLNPDKTDYDRGEKLMPEFFFRNRNKTSKVRLPWTIELNKGSIVVRDNFGNDINVSFQDVETRVSLRTLEETVSGETRLKRFAEIIAIHSDDPEPTKMARVIIHAEADQPVRLHFVVPNFSDLSAPPLTTGEIEFNAIDSSIDWQK